MILSVWLSILTITIEIVAAAKGPIPAPKTEQEVITVLANDKLIGPLLVGVALNLIVTLVRMVWSRERKDLEEIKEAVKLIRPLHTQVTQLDDHVKKNVPTKEQVDLKIYKALHGKEFHE